MSEAVNDFELAGPTASPWRPLALAALMAVTLAGCASRSDYQSPGLRAPAA